MDKTEQPAETVERIFNATSMHHLDKYYEDGVLVKKKYVLRDDAEENISRIFGND